MIKRFVDFVTLQRGFDLPKTKMCEGFFPVVGSTSIIGYHNEFKVEPPGVVTGRSGSLGTVQYINEPFWPHNTTLWVRDFKGNNPRFVYYRLQAFDFAVFNAGAGIPTLNRNHLDKLEVEAPPIHNQRKIAAILSAYDDLIENNLRRIKILEEMAQALYREWFVNFRFPGHEKVRMVDSPLGTIPEGWNFSNFGDVTLNFDRLRKPLSTMERSQRKGFYPYYGAAKIIDYIDNYIFNDTYLLIAEDGSVITPDRKPVLQYVSGKFWANNHTHIIQGKNPISNVYLYLMLKGLDITGYISGAAQPKITQANLNRIPVLIPNEVLLTQFNSMVEDIFSVIIIYQKKISTLRNTRDLLLPKLISGEVDVSDLDIVIPEEA